jgi:hypothetical protein
MALYVSYVVGGSLACYLGNKLFYGGNSNESTINEETKENKYIVEDKDENIVVVEEKQVPEIVVEEEKESEIVVKEQQEPPKDLYKCSRCDTMLELKLFSKTQRKKNRELWKCKVCAKLC